MLVDVWSPGEQLGERPVQLSGWRSDRGSELATQRSEAGPACRDGNAQSHTNSRLSPVMSQRYITVWSGVETSGQSLSFLWQLYFYWSILFFNSCKICWELVSWSANKTKYFFKWIMTQVIISTFVLYLKYLLWSLQKQVEIKVK